MAAGPTAASAPALVRLSGANEEQLRRRVEQALEEATVLDDDASATAVAAGPTEGTLRAAAVAQGPRRLEDELRRIAAWLEEGAGAEPVRAEGGALLARTDLRARIGVLFPGQGVPVYAGPGALGRLVPAAAAAHAAAGLDAKEGAVPAERVQLAIVASCLSGLAAVRAAQISPCFALGHSLGELVALHWSGALALEELLELTCVRGEAMTRSPTTAGTMATIDCGDEDFAGLIEGQPVQLACENSPTQRVIAGETAAVEACVDAARRQGFRAIRLRVNGAFHSPLMAPAARLFRRALATARLEEPRRPVASTVTGGWLPANADLRSLLVEQLTSPVRFLEAVRAAAPQADVMIEVGPGRTLTGLTARCVELPCVALESGSISPTGPLRLLGLAWACGLGAAPGPPK